MAFTSTRRWDTGRRKISCHRNKGEGILKKPSMTFPTGEDAGSLLGWLCIFHVSYSFFLPSLYSRHQNDCTSPDLPGCSRAERARSRSKAVSCAQLPAFSKGKLQSGFQRWRETCRSGSCWKNPTHIWLVSHLKKRGWRLERLELIG